MSVRAGAWGTAIGGYARGTSRRAVAGVFGVKERSASRLARGLLALIVLYMVVPILDIPFLGVSLSFVFFLILGLELLRGGIPWQPQRHRLLLAAGGAYAAAALVSYLTNWIGAAAFSWNSLLLAFRLPYWVGCMVLTALFIARLPAPQQLLKLAAVAIVLLGVARLVTLLVGMETRGGGAAGLSQNSVGLVFSTFWPAALYFAVTARKRWAAGLGMTLLVLAVIVNASRGSWVAIVATSGVAVVLLMREGRLGVRTGARVLAFVALVGGLSVAVLPRLLPEPAVERLTARAQTFEELEWDASYQTRVAMRRKAWSLFRDNPVLGVGPGRFRQESAEFELPDRLRGKSLEVLNRKNSHSAYLQLLAETGLTGAASFAALLLFLGIAGYRAALALARAGALWGLAVLLCFVGMSIHLIVIAGLLGTLPWFVYGLVGGMIAWVRGRLAVHGSRGRRPVVAVPMARANG